MWGKIQKLFDRLESRWSLYGLLGGSGTVSAISGWIAAQTRWLDEYGAIAWWFAALSGGLIFALMFLAICWGRWKLIQAKAVGRWAEAADNINPMDDEFRSQRIKLTDLANPITKKISGKRFVKCELIGPITVALNANNDFKRNNFVSVNLIPIKNNWPIYPIYSFEHCDFIECQILDANLLFPISFVSTLEEGFSAKPDYVSLTGIAEIDSRSHRGTRS